MQNVGRRMRRHSLAQPTGLCSSRSWNDLHTDEQFPEQGSEESPPDRDITRFGITRHAVLCCTSDLYGDRDSSSSFSSLSSNYILRAIYHFERGRANTYRSWDELGISPAPRALGSYLGHRNITSLTFLVNAECKRRP